MVELQIKKVTAKSGATEFKIEPSSVSLGNFMAHKVDKCKVIIPEEWKDYDVRVTIIPNGMIKQERYSPILSDQYTFDITEEITKFKNGGVIVVDAYEVGVDLYHAYTADCIYTVAEHAKVGGNLVISHTPSEYEYYLGEVKEYRKEVEHTIELAGQIEDFREEIYDVDERVKDNLEQSIEALNTTIVARDAAGSARDQAYNMKELAEEARNGAIDAYDSAVAAKNAAFTANTLAQSAAERTEAVYADVVRMDEEITEKTEEAMRILGRPATATDLGSVKVGEYLDITADGVLSVDIELKDIEGDATHRLVTDEEKRSWNAKSTFDGRYSSLVGAPTDVSSFNNDAGYITDAALDGYATESWVENKNYAPQSNTYTKSEVDSKIAAGGKVQSVNGQTGVVVLDAAAVGALPDDTYIPDAYDDTAIWNAVNGKQPAGDYATSTELNGVKTIAESAKTTAENAEEIAKGASKGLVFDTVEAMNAYITEHKDELILGTNLYIRAVNVPDYWWDGTQAQQLETQKVDLSEYVKNTDYANNTTAGAIKVRSNVGTAVDASGFLYATNRSFEQYTSDGNGAFIGKGTLETVLSNKDFDKVFIATYGTTTFAEISQAVADGKDIRVTYQNVLYRYVLTSNGTAHYFSSFAGTSIMRYVLVQDTNRWGLGTFQVQTQITDLDAIRSGAALGATSVQTGAQTLTDAQKAQAKANIDASRITNIVLTRTWTRANFATFAAQGREETWSVDSGKDGIVVGDIITLKATISDVDNLIGYILIQVVDLLPDNPRSVKGKTLFATTQNYLAIDDTTNTSAKTWSSEKIAQRFSEVEMAKFPNVTIMGQPTINNGQISNFSATNYCMFPFMVDFAGRPFEILFKITTGTDVSQQHNIIDSLFGLAIAVRSSKFVIAMSSNGTSWNLGESVGSHTVTASTGYLLKFKWDGTAYELDYSTNNGESWVTDIVKASTATLAPKQILIGKSTDSGTIFNGIVDLNSCSLTISNKLVWQGMDDVGLSTRMAIDMSNIDDAGIAKLKELAEVPTSGYMVKIEYANTSSEDIQAILDAGNNPYIIYGSNTYYYQDISYDNYYRFVSFTPGSNALTDPPVIKRIYKSKNSVANQGWGTGSVTLYSTIHKPKTSELTNDAGFITSADVPTPLQGEQGWSIVANVDRPSVNEATWNMYGTVGRSEAWTNTAAARNGCRINDIFTVSGTATDTGNAHILFFKSTTASGNLSGECMFHSVAKAGKNYTITDADYDAIAERTLALIDDGTEVEY